jgi:hypothetical protein
MFTISHPTEHWTPISAEERELVQKELDAILSSYHFRGSKRYPALLKYVVDAALEGRSRDLKERTLGVEVFGRPPDYDTNADPVVRFSASEVRKRIAQYYHENEGRSRLQIELPLGSYMPEFLLRTPEIPEPPIVVESAEPSFAQSHSPENRRRYRLAALSLFALLAAAAVFGTYSYRRISAANTDATDKLWGPVIKPTGPILIVVGTSHPEKMMPEPDQTSFIDHMTGPYHHISLASAIALANVAGVLRQHGSAYEIKEDTETSLTDIRSRPLILVGATNNAWTMRLVNALRFRFISGPMAQVQDTKNLQNAEWSIDFSKPYSSVATDYAIVARFHDATTEGPVMVIAGLGPYGTEAASEFVDTPQYLEQIVKKVPAGWENKNFEMVLKSNVIDGKPGPPVLVASTVW